MTKIIFVASRVLLALAALWYALAMFSVYSTVSSWNTTVVWNACVSLIIVTSLTWVAFWRPGSRLLSIILFVGFCAGSIWLMARYEESDGGDSAGGVIIMFTTLLLSGACLFLGSFGAPGAGGSGGGRSKERVRRSSPAVNGNQLDRQ